MDNHFWLLIHILALCTTSISGKVFVSIDCGASGSFTDGNSIEWKGDGDLISNGVTHVVQFNQSVSRVMDTLRVFTTRKKNCYSIEVEEGEKVLVRAGFNYGNYDQKSTPPMFDLLFDGNLWTTVNSSVWKMYEAIYVVKKKVTSICVAQTNPNQFPFISTLEVRSLDSQMYFNIGSNYALFLNLRSAYAINETIRYVTLLISFFREVKTRTHTSPHEYLRSPNEIFEPTITMLMDITILLGQKRVDLVN